MNDPITPERLASLVDSARSITAHTPAPFDRSHMGRQARAVLELAAEVDRLRAELTTESTRANWQSAQRGQAETRVAELEEQLGEVPVKVTEGINAELALTNREMAALAQLEHDIRHERCSEVWRGYFGRVAVAYLDGGEGRG